MKPTMSTVEVIAGVFLTGAHLCIRDDGELGILATPEQEAAIRATGIYDALGAHYFEVRASILTGIHHVLDGYLPALDGLEAHELRGAP